MIHLFALEYLHIEYLHIKLISDETEIQSISLL